MRFDHINIDTQPPAGMVAIKQRFGSADVFAAWLAHRSPVAMTLNGAHELIAQAIQAGAMKITTPPGGMVVYVDHRRMEALFKQERKAA